ncbi:MAG: RHS repeat protein [Acidobacteria bacterium]|nr:RHS repeat protein [Acidobacteriota bacterium]MBI3421327.1 RHS repeat protein [Acidobacteriota bacterium]
MSQEIAGSVFDDANGAAIAPGGSVRIGTRLRLHTRGVSNGSCQTKNPDCTNGAVVERYASDIAISVDINTGTGQDGNVQLKTVTGKDPVTGLPQDFHLLDSTATNAQGGPGLYQPTTPGTYKFNFVLTTQATPCDIQPTQYTASITLHVIDAIDTLNNGDWTRGETSQVVMTAASLPSVGGGGAAVGGSLVVANNPAAPLSSKANPTNSNIYHYEVDLELPLVDGSVPLARHYNKLSKFDGAFGYGWTSLFDVSINEQGGNQLRMLRDDGSTVFFEATGTIDPETGGDLYNATVPRNFYGTLAKGPFGFKVKQRNGWVYEFNTLGKLTAIADRNNNRITLARPGLTGTLVGSVTDAFGRSFAVNYGFNSTRVSSITFNGATVATYTYGGFNNTQVTYADGSQYRHQYNERGLTTVRDALNNILTKWTFDDVTGQLISVERANGVEKLTYNYVRTPSSGALTPDQPGETDVTDALDRVTKYFFISGSNAACNGNACPIAPLSRAAIIRTERQSVEGNLINSFVLDANENLTQAVDQLGRTTLYSYNPAGDVTTIIDVLGTLSFTYNSFGQVLIATDRMSGVTTNGYDSKGNLLTTTDMTGRTSTFVYDGQGLVTGATDPRGISSTFTYSAGQVASRSMNGGHTMNYQYYARGWLAQVTDTNGHSTNYTRDLVGHVLTVSDTLGAPPFVPLAAFEYDLAGRRTKATDARGNATTYTYDNAYRLTTETDAASNTTNYIYDKMSNLQKVTDPLVRVTDLVYDDLDRLRRVNYPLGLFERYEYDAGHRLIRRIDTAGRLTRFTYDVGDRLTRELDPAGNDTQYSYNPRSQVLQVTDARNQRYEFSYDAVGRVLQTKRGGREWSFTYDGDGNRATRTDAKGNTTTYAYNELNNLTTITYANGGTQTYAYDVLGRMTGATNATGTVTLSYDARSRVTGTTDVWGQTLGYQYDNNNNRTQMTLGASQTTYAYDVLDRVTQMAHNSVGATTFAYDPVSRLTNRTLANGVAATASYDPLDRLTRLTYAKGANTIADWQYQFDDAHQITQIAEPTGNRTYTYDVLNRLTAATRPGQASESYAYDAVGNRTASHLSTVYNYLSFNRLSATADANFTYDANGNLKTKVTAQGTWEYDWDSENRLIRVTRPDLFVVNYRYDALGRRVERRTGPGEWTRFTYDGMDVVLDRQPGGVSLEYGNGFGMDNKLWQKANGGLPTWYVTDQQTSTRALTNGAGSVIGALDYDAYGNSVGSAQTRYDYTGRERDLDTGLLYYRARWYDPQAGRFISEDPIGLKGGMNMFGYVGGNPVGKADPTGLCDCEKKTDTNCSRFVRVILGFYAFGPDAYSLGTALLLQSRVFQLTTAKNMPTGFREELVGQAGLKDNNGQNVPYQGSDVYQHVLAHAGATLIGDSRLPLASVPLFRLSGFVGDKYPFTGQQLTDFALGQDVRERDVPGAHGSQDPNGVEAAQEVNDDLAGRTIGILLRNALKAGTTRKNLLPHVYNVLCF